MYRYISGKFFNGEWTAILLLAILFSITSSCSKNEGLGGNGSISGVVMEHFYNDDYSELIYSVPAVDEEVFILFGNDKTPGDRVNTGTSGDFRFDYLYPGTYHIYFRSQDSVNIPEDEWELIQVSVDGGEAVNLGNLQKTSTLDWDDGAAVITGVVTKTKYDNDSKWPNLVEEYTDFAHEHEVYLTYGNHTFYDKRVRTQDDGRFEFRNLIPGNYRIFLYSEDVTKKTEHVVLEYNVTITEFDQVFEIEDDINVKEI